MTEFKIVSKLTLIIVTVLIFTSCASNSSIKAKRSTASQPKIDQDAYDHFRRIDSHNINRHSRW